mmetsp:Transcript_25876/g.69893  ORF Transcript_25876/g.69893 Transcript_25876/m.69893 type:complete len:167 (-) Transcript_25876:1475-1975(-)
MRSVTVSPDAVSSSAAVAVKLHHGRRPRHHPCPGSPARCRVRLLGSYYCCAPAGFRHESEHADESLLPRLLDRTPPRVLSQPASWPMEPPLLALERPIASTGLLAARDRGLRQGAVLRRVPPGVTAGCSAGCAAPDPCSKPACPGFSSATWSDATRARDNVRVREP